MSRFPVYNPSDQQTDFGVGRQQERTLDTYSHPPGYHQTTGNVYGGSQYSPPVDHYSANLPYAPPPAVYGHQTNTAYNTPYGNQTNTVYTTPYKPSFPQIPAVGSSSILHGTKLNGDLPISIRHGFIKKVYALLMVQLTITFATAMILLLIPATATFLLRNYWLAILCFVLSFGILMVLLCVRKVAHKYPTNIILMSIVSLCFGVTFAYLAFRVSFETFLSALGMTLVVVIAITIFAFQTKIDFTGYASYLLVGVVVLVCFGVLCAILRSKILRLVYAAIGVLVFSFFLVFDTQKIIGGNHENQYAVDQYVEATLSLYLDIINIFTLIVSLLGYE